jgi:Matrixin
MNESNSLNINNAARTAIYRPKYRSKIDNPKYELETASRVRNKGVHDPMASLHALEEWCAQDMARERSLFVRWHPEKAQSLSLHIAPPHDPDLTPLVLSACREWEASSGGLIHIYQGIIPEQADIRIEWTDTPTLGREFEVGHTDRAVQAPCWIHQATVTLLTNPEIDKHLFPEQVQRRLYTTVLHELGHALGLEHSQNKADVMHHQGWRNRQLTLNDIQGLQELYQAPVPTLYVV